MHTACYRRRRLAVVEKRRLLLSETHCILMLQIALQRAFVFIRSHLLLNRRRGRSHTGRSRNRLVPIQHPSYSLRHRKLLLQSLNRMHVFSSRRRRYWNRHHLWHARCVLNERRIRKKQLLGWPTLDVRRELSSFRRVATSYDPASCDIRREAPLLL